MLALSAPLFHDSLDKLAGWRVLQVPTPGRHQKQCSRNRHISVRHPVAHICDNASSELLSLPICDTLNSYTKESIMAKKKFTSEQIEQLRSNPYTYKVTSCQIFFTAEFKERFYQLRQEGLTLNEVIISLGYDPEVLGEKRIDGISHLINKAVREGKGFREGTHPRTSILDEECPELTRENFLKMQHELLYLRQEMDFLKKFPR